MTHIGLVGYLSEDYLTGPYLGNLVDGETTGFQALLTIQASKPVGFQSLLERHLNVGVQSELTIQRQQAVGFQSQLIHRVNTGFQSLLQVFTDVGFGFQSLLERIARVGFQGTFVLYNITQLRVLTLFLSRGKETTGGTNAWGNDEGIGQNWLASSTATGDFDVANLNTDVPEEVWRSADGDLTSVNLRCDTERPQGVFLDTLAILNHNLSKSASVKLQGSTLANFATVGFEVTLTIEANRNDIFYVAPTLPLTAYRYWRLLLEDPTNTNGHLEIGIVIFGAARIFSTADDFTNPLEKGRRDFKNEMPTEGYTSISNHRALRRWLKLRFEDMDYLKGNYRLLDEVLTFARTDLKCLWIPTPDFAARHALFGKVAELPAESVTSNEEENEYYTVEFQVDESK